MQKTQEKILDIFMSINISLKFHNIIIKLKQKMNLEYFYIALLVK